MECSWTEGKGNNGTETHPEPYKYCELYTRVYPKVSGLAAWSENCKW